MIVKYFFYVSLWVSFIKFSEIEDYTIQTKTHITFLTSMEYTFMHDFHATILHLLGLEHERLSYYHHGIERRLTDVRGDVVSDLITQVLSLGIVSDISFS